MYCINCGKELKDDAAFCTGCGAQTKAAVSAAAAKEEKLSVKEIVIGLLGIVLVIVLIINCKAYNDKKKAIVKAKGASSYQELMENYCDSIETLDKDMFIKCVIPTSITKEHKDDDNYKDAEYYVTNSLYSMQNYLIGSDISDYSIELDDIYNVSVASSDERTEIQDYFDSIYSNFGYKSTPEIKQAMNIKCNFVWKEGKKKGTWQDSFTVAYLDNEGWYIVEL